MSNTRILGVLLANVPKYSGRTGAALGTAMGFVTADVLDRMENRWGDGRNITTSSQLKNLVTSFCIFGPLGYGTGFLAGKGIVKAKTVADQSKLVARVKNFVKKL